MVVDLSLLPLNLRNGEVCKDEEDSMLTTANELSLHNGTHINLHLFQQQVPLVNTQKITSLKFPIAHFHDFMRKETFFCNKQDILNFLHRADFYVLEGI